MLENKFGDLEHAQKKSNTKIKEILNTLKSIYAFEEKINTYDRTMRKDIEALSNRMDMISEDISLLKSTDEVLESQCSKIDRKVEESHVMIQNQRTEIDQSILKFLSLSIKVKGCEES